MGQFGVIGAGSNEPVSVLSRWQAPGQVTNVAKFTTIETTAYNHLFQSDGFYSDAAFIRLKNVALSYNFPAEWLKKHGISRASLFMKAQNLFFLSGYSGLDPEDPGGLPIPRVITAGFSINY